MTLSGRFVCFAGPSAYQWTIRITMSTRRRLWLAILWGFLLFVGAPIFVMSYVEEWDFLAAILARLPIGFWTTWTFVMLYDIWFAARMYLDKEAVNAETKGRETEESSDEGFPSETGEPPKRTRG